MFKLIALDMDGTLLKGDNTISQETKKAINLAKEKGIKIVITTGRPIQGVMNYLEELDLINDDEYVITYNGSSVYNTKTLEPIIRNGITGKDFKDIYKLSKSLGVEFHGFIDECCIAPKENKYTETETLHNNIDVKIIDIENDINDNDFIIKAMILDEKEKLDEAVKNIPKEYFEKYNALRTVSFIFEFMNKDCSKSNALKALCKHLDISPNEVIAFGDGDNDIDMLQFAELGVAMGNSSHYVKSKADYITLSNEEDGIADVIYKKILNI
ncbi:Cof-type HAD-IIB family hydrolase [Clostridium paraputrificum]|uniref:Cof-type HAD-IIB family hydrolase n=1 Tax=Clostridium paraputrificum TaxID=29363 RepID=UPI000DCFD9DE|nr:Cof-type HAD-IIB family hydrolase [Clostridium paraputrificum]